MNWRKLISRQFKPWWWKLIVFTLIILCIQEHSSENLQMNISCKGAVQIKTTMNINTLLQKYILLSSNSWIQHDNHCFCLEDLRQNDISDSCLGCILQKFIVFCVFLVRFELVKIWHILNEMDFIVDIFNQNTTIMCPHLTQTLISQFSGFVA